MTGFHAKTVTFLLFAGNSERKIKMKHLLLTTIAAAVLVEGGMGDQATAMILV
jgi:hypothetical protein